MADTRKYYFVRRLNVARTRRDFRYDARPIERSFYRVQVTRTVVDDDNICRHSHSCQKIMVPGFRRLPQQTGECPGKIERVGMYPVIGKADRGEEAGSRRTRLK